MLSRDEESTDENGTTGDKACPKTDDILFSTLGSPIDATPITPQPIPNEISYSAPSPSCLRHSKYASTRPPDQHSPPPMTSSLLTHRQVSKQKHL